MRKLIIAVFLLFAVFVVSTQIAYAGTEGPTDCPATEPGCPPPPDPTPTPTPECPPDDNVCLPPPEDCPSTEPGCPPPPEYCPITEPGCWPPPVCPPDDTECVQTETEPTTRKTDYKRLFSVPLRIIRLASRR